MITRSLALAATLALIGVAGCGGDDEDEGSEGASSATTTAAATTPSGAETDTDAAAGGPGAQIKVSDSEFGKMLFDSKDQAIYLFDKETSDKPDCYGACAEAWPPVLTQGQPQAAAGADAAKLGTTKRRDGTTQVTYNDHPLYFYAHEGPGEVLCHNVEEFGGLWLVVQPSGDAAPA